MSKGIRNSKVYIDDILEAIMRIIEYCSPLSYDEFLMDNKTKDSLVRNFEVLAEASKNESKKIKEKFSDIPWVEMYLLRNKIAHEYFGVDYEILWDVAKNYLPENLKSLHIIRESI